MYEQKVANGEVIPIEDTYADDDDDDSEEETIVDTETFVYDENFNPFANGYSPY